MAADDNSRMTAASLAALPSGAVRLSDWGVIRASGEDARAFLHGQLTQDVLQLPEGQARLAGFCSAKGRLQASFLIWRDGPQDVLMACSNDLLPGVLKRLSLFVLRARCRLADASSERGLWGLAGGAAASMPGLDASPPVGSVQDLGGGTQAIRLHDAAVEGVRVPRWLYMGVDAPSLPVLPLADWLALEVLSGVPRITAATAEHFVPQMVNLELVDGVNFRKGCYPGQEVVARSQYRGTLKRRAWAVQAPQALAPGQEVFHSEDPQQPAGMVVLAGTLAGRHVALVELKIAAAQSGSLHAGQPDGPVLLKMALPYPVPLESTPD